MRTALQLAQLATGYTSPNPLVGSLVVKDNQVVGRGYHKLAGEAHAEVQALQDAGEQCRDATLYITLEPCTHHGRTPPCTDAIIASGVSTVVYATGDTNPNATGGGKVLENAGIKTVCGVLEDEARQVNRFYFHHLSTGRPWVVGKFASSLDGRIATRTGDSQWITQSTAREHGHTLRQAVDGIIVGTQTVIADDPQLTVRLPGEPRHPLRIVLDSTGRIPLSSRVLSAEIPGKTLVVCTDAMSATHAQKLRDKDVDVLRVETTDSHQIDINQLLQALGERGLQSLMIEGGQTLLGSFLDNHLINELWAFIAPMLIGGVTAPAAIGGLGIDKLDSAARLSNLHIEQLGDDVLIRGELNYGGTNA